MGYEKLLGMGYKIFLGIIYKKFLKMGYEKFLRMCFEKFLRIGSDIFPGNNHKKISSPGQTQPLYSVHPRNFSMENLPGNSQENLQFLWTFSMNFPCERFLEILTNS